MKIAQIVRESGSQPLRAYHGTRHSFERFQMKAVGSGEGFQSFGYGLYFAENLEVATYYADKLGEPVKPTDPHAGMIYEVAIDVAPDQLLDWDARLAQQSRFVQDALGDHLWREEPTLDGKRFADALQDIPSTMRVIAFNLYRQAKGDLQAFEHALQARVANAPEQTQGYAAQIIQRMRNAEISSAKQIKPGLGMHMVEELRQQYGSPRAASKVMLTSGIMGLRYLDQESRDLTGTPTHNYVIFSARPVKVVRKFKVKE